MEKGVISFAAVWRAFVAQWTQPQILRLWSEYLSTRAVHSSQIEGFKQGRLVEPGPKVLVAIGYVNVALAHSIGHPEELIEKVTDIGYADRLPASLEHLWSYRSPLLDADGVAMGPTGVFEAFCGLRDLPNTERPSLTALEAEEASLAIGSYLRLQLPTLGIDWFEELETLTERCPSVRPLLMKKFVDADRLIQDLERIASIANTSSEKLWGVIDHALGR